MNDLYVWVDKELNLIASLPESLPVNWKNYNGLGGLSEKKLNELGWYKVDDSNLLKFNYTDEWFFQFKKQILEHISFKRWEAQTEIVTYDGNMYILNDTTINSLYQKRITVESDPSSSFYWKTVNGIVELNSSKLIYLTDAISSYIQKCFDVEASFIKNISNISTLKNLLQVNLNISWPSTTLT